jgi:hypothetical protein
MKKTFLVVFLLLIFQVLAYGQGAGSLPAGGSSVDLTNPGPIGGSTPAAGTFTTVTSTANGTASTPSVSLTGAPYTAGTATTNVPLFYLNDSGVAPTTWSANGTFAGANAPSGFTGNFLDFHLNGGASIFKVASTGSVTLNGSLASNGSVNAAGTSSMFWSGRSQILSPLDGIIELANNGASGFTRLDLGGTTSSFGAIQTNGTTTQSELADGTAQAPFSASLFKTETNCASSASPAVCASASTGSIVVAAGATTVTVNTTNVTANSVIQITEDSSLGAKLSVTCNTTLIRTYAVSARSAGTSFTITSSAAPTTNPACLNYLVFN